MRLVLSLALILFFGWFAADTLMSLLAQPLEGIYYPMASGRLKSVPHDWTQKPWFGAPLYLARLAALTTAFLMAPFWIVSVISADLHGLDVNGWWAASMAYANISFLLYSFIGDGDPGQINF
jgi:hypothetical protein